MICKTHCRFAAELVGAAMIGVNSRLKRSNDRHGSILRKR